MSNLVGSIDVCSTWGHCRGKDAPCSNTGSHDKTTAGVVSGGRALYRINLRMRPERNSGPAGAGRGGTRHRPSTGRKISSQFKIHLATTSARRVWPTAVIARRAGAYRSVVRRQPPAASRALLPAAALPISASTRSIRLFDNGVKH